MSGKLLERGAHKRGRRPFGLFRDEDGFTTVGVALALLVTLALVFTSAQVYRVSSASADVQDVADAAALAAENEVAEFMIAVRVCDAVVLSLSLTGAATAGLGVAALCTPATAGASEVLLKAARKVVEARDEFAEKAAAGLNRLQKALPFLAAANAASTASANDGGPMGASYVALAVLVPADGEELGVGAVEGAEGLVDDAEREADGIRQAAADAEEAAREANAWKERAFLRDCGDDPSYCMSERARTLAGMAGADNPRYASVDAWSFSVALDRARAYYARRLAVEAPEGSSTEERARSALRQRFYAYAADEAGRGYVRESADSFDARFPHLPKNTDEMRGTALYTEAVYPTTVDGSGNLVVHAWPGCPGAGGAAGAASIAQMEAGGNAPCPACGFTAASMGKVAAASTSIENGFEYHYEAVAQAAEEYQRARAKLGPLTAEVKGRAGGLLDRCRDVLGRAGGMRIDAAPPGRFGVVAFVANTAAAAASTGFASGYVHEAGSLGARAAVSAATLLAGRGPQRGLVAARRPAGEGRCGGGRARRGARLLVGAAGSLPGRAGGLGGGGWERRGCAAVRQRERVGDVGGRRLQGGGGGAGPRTGKARRAQTGPRELGARGRCGRLVVLGAVPCREGAGRGASSGVDRFVLVGHHGGGGGRRGGDRGTRRHHRDRLGAAARRRGAGHPGDRRVAAGGSPGRSGVREQCGRRAALVVRPGNGGEDMGVARSDARERGQMTVELAVVFPVLLAVAVIAVNALLFFSECAAFDRVAREAVRVHAASPACGQGLEQSCALVSQTVEQAFDRPYVGTRVAVEGTAGGHARFTATIEFSPTLFGLGLKSSVFGVALPHLEHAVSLTVDPYKPGVLL